MVYFAKEIKISESRIINEIIKELLQNLNESNQFYLYYEEKLFFAEYLLDYFSIEDAKIFKDIIERIISKPKRSKRYFDDDEKSNTHKINHTPLLFLPNPVKI